MSPSGIDNPGNLRASQSDSSLNAPFWAWFLLCALLVAAMAYLRLVTYPDRVLPLAYGLPLLVCLLHRNIWILYGMAVSFSAIAMYKVFGRLQVEHGDTGYEYMVAAMLLTSIWVVAGAIHGMIHFMSRIERQNTLLELANSELEASNEELATREEEIARQNEELQSQAEELEQQAEELRQHTEEMERQSGELRNVNEELHRREKGLHTLLGSARWLRRETAETDVLGAICQAAVQVMDDRVVAAAIVQEQDGRVWLREQCGFGVHGAVHRQVTFDRSFASLVMERRETGFLEDIQTRPDLDILQPVAGPPFRSLMAAPIWSEGQVIGAVELYANRPRAWTEDEFSVAEWLAAQAALALQAMEYQQELELKRREAEEASIQKTRFLAAVSHDVRTPVNAISLLADLVERTADDPRELTRVVPMLKDLKANARALVELVSDVLDLARFDSGGLEIEVSEFSATSLVDGIIRQFQPTAQAKGVPLVADLPDEPIWLRTDKMKLARVLGNLVGNAIKFTESGEIQIIAHPGDGGGVELSIRDSGVGISPEHLSRIFDEFYQLRNPERDRNKGTGLGLAICRRLVDGLGCSISVESTLGTGSTFTLRLPAEFVVGPPASPGHDDDAAPVAVGTAGAFLKGVQVLLVEDHDATRAATAQVLAGHGATVLQASDCRSGLQLLANENPHVLLLDLMLPDRDGTEILRALRQRRPDRLRCVLALSGDVRDARAEEVRRLGADALIPKPITADTLLAVLRKHLRSHSAMPHDHAEVSRPIRETDPA